MLQNPSKYHTNHHYHHNNYNHQLSSHTSTFQQQYNPTKPIIMHQNYPITTNHHLITNNNYSPSANSNSSLDGGKSFTIAAILGLQQSAIDSNHKDCNSVINLSINNHHHHHHNDYHEQMNNNNQTQNQTQEQQQQQKHTTALLSVVKTSNITKMYNDSAIRITNSVNSLNCDNNNKSLVSSSNVVSRYLPPANGISIFVQSSSSSDTKDMHSFKEITNRDLTSSNNTRTAPTALQSLQKLHQHHAQQSKIAFQREKLKSENVIKKTSLKNKRVRTIFTPEQLERLEAEFERQQYMVGPERLYLAHTLQLSEAQVKVWFQNRRIKWRKHHLEITQQRLALLRQGKLPLAGHEDMDVKEMSENIRLISGNWLPLESDLSVCNESIDTESLAEDDE